jgi:hypothetical protein
VSSTRPAREEASCLRHKDRAFYALAQRTNRAREEASCLRCTTVHVCHRFFLSDQSPRRGFVSSTPSDLLAGYDLNAIRAREEASCLRLQPRRAFQRQRKMV